LQEDFGDEVFVFDDAQLFYLATGDLNSLGACMGKVPTSRKYGEKRRKGEAPYGEHEHPEKEVQ
jgi:hypothetical protein